MAQDAPHRRHTKHRHFVTRTRGFPLLVSEPRAVPSLPWFPSCCRFEISACWTTALVRPWLPRHVTIPTALTSPAIPANTSKLYLTSLIPSPNSRTVEHSISCYYRISLWAPRNEIAVLRKQRSEVFGKDTGSEQFGIGTVLRQSFHKSFALHSAIPPNHLSCHRSLARTLSVPPASALSSRCWTSFGIVAKYFTAMPFAQPLSFRLRLVRILISTS